MAGDRDAVPYVYGVGKALVLQHFYLAWRNGGLGLHGRRVRHVLGLR